MKRGHGVEADDVRARGERAYAALGVLERSLGAGFAVYLERARVAMPGEVEYLNVMPVRAGNRGDRKDSYEDESPIIDRTSQEYRRWDHHADIHCVTSLPSGRHAARRGDT